MNPERITAGLWRWTAPHPAWTPDRGGPGGWERMVGCVYFEAPDALVLIDPQAPPEGTAEARRFWSALDDDVRRAGTPVAVLVTNAYHGRDADRVCQRYRGPAEATLHVPAAASSRLSCSPTHRYEAGASLPGGVSAHAVEGLDTGETAFFLPGPRALVFADAVIGAGDGRVRVAPESWAAEGEAARARYAAAFRPSIRRLLALRPAMLLPSHGEVVLEGGTEALAEALDAPGWGQAA